jgi:signal transduction histidine kinase
VRLGLGSNAAPEKALAMLAEARREVSLAIEELREIAHGLEPRVLSEAGLAEAMSLAAARSPVPVELLALPEARLDMAAETTAYYVFLEAVTNAQKHARASVVRVRAVARDGYLQVEIADDGVGGAVATPGSGLQGLCDRVEAVGGRFTLESNTGRGTTVYAAIPATPSTRM